MFGRAFFGDRYFGPRWFGDGENAVAPQPEPEQPQQGSGGVSRGRPYRPPRIEPRPEPAPIAVSVVTGQGGQHADGVLDLRIDVVGRSMAPGLVVAGAFDLSLEGVASSDQRQSLGGYLWPTLRGELSSEQATSAVEIAADLVVAASVDSGGDESERVPAYAGVPLPKIFLNEPERHRRGT